jgi:ADP-heptose:LPS heptosyltransferase
VESEQVESARQEALLCVKVASRGDLLLAGPAFAALRRQRPSANIVLVVGRTCEDVARRLPFFDEVHTVDDRSLLAGTFVERVRVATHLLRMMRRGSGTPRVAFSEVFIFHRDPRYSVIAALARIPARRGITRRRRQLLTEAHRPSAREHDVDQYLELVRLGTRAIAEPPVSRAPTLAGVWRFEPGEREAALLRASGFGFDPARPFVALGFGGGRNVKTRTHLKSWPLGHYRELARRIEELGVGVVWLGDEEDARDLGEMTVGVNLAGRLAVPESAAVLGACQVTVANDSLLLHLSEAVGTPTVGLFGPTDPRHYGPRGPRSEALWLGDALPCSPCYVDGRFPLCRYEHRCMKELTVDSVLSSARKVLQQDQGPCAVRVISRGEGLAGRVDVQ